MTWRAASSDVEQSTRWAASSDVAWRTWWAARETSLTLYRRRQRTGREQDRQTILTIETAGMLTHSSAARVARDVLLELPKTTTRDVMTSRLGLEISECAPLAPFFFQTTICPSFASPRQPPPDTLGGQEQRAVADGTFATRQPPWTILKVSTNDLLASYPSQDFASGGLGRTWQEYQSRSQ